MVDGRNTAKEDVVLHDESILPNPISRRIEAGSLQKLKDRLNTADISIAVLAIA